MKHKSYQIVKKLDDKEVKIVEYNSEKIATDMFKFLEENKGNKDIIFEIYKVDSDGTRVPINPYEVKEDKPLTELSEETKDEINSVEEE